MKIGDEFYGDHEDQYQLVDRHPETLERAEDELEAVGEIYERGREHEHGRDVVEEDDPQREDAGRVQALGRDREYPPAPQVVRLGHVSGVEEYLEEQDKDEEEEEEPRTA